MAAEKWKQGSKQEVNPEHREWSSLQGEIILNREKLFCERIYSLRKQVKAVLRVQY